jgi:hypothetical protein
VNKKLIHRYYAAWNTLNTDSPASFYAKDASLVFFDVIPFKYKEGPNIRRGFRRPSLIKYQAAN